MRVFVFLSMLFISVLHAQEARFSYGVSGSYFLTPIPASFGILLNTPGNFYLRSDKSFSTGIWCAYRLKNRLSLSLNANYLNRGITILGNQFDSKGIIQNRTPFHGADIILMFNYLHPLPNHNKFILGLGLQHEYFFAFPLRGHNLRNDKNKLFTWQDEHNIRYTIHVDMYKSLFNLLGEIGFLSNLNAWGKLRFSCNFSILGRNQIYYIYDKYQPVRQEFVTKLFDFKTVQARLVWIMPDFFKNKLAKEM